MFDCLINTMRESLKVAILGADDDAGMLWMSAMESDEVLSIDGDHAASGCDREAKNCIVLNTLIGPASIVSR